MEVVCVCVWERERKEEEKEKEGGEISAALYTSVVASIPSPSLLRLAMCRWWPTEQLLQVGGGTQRHSMGTRVFLYICRPCAHSEKEKREKGKKKRKRKTRAYQNKLHQSVLHIQREREREREREKWTAWDPMKLKSIGKKLENSNFKRASTIRVSFAASLFLSLSLSRPLTVYVRVLPAPGDSEWAWFQRPISYERLIITFIITLYVFLYET